MSDPVVSFRNLTKRFPKQNKDALCSITADIPQGKIVGIIGPDGAGKTTLLRMIMGLLTPTAGSVFALGHDVFKAPEDIRKHISYMPQQFGLYEDLTVIQNLELYAVLRGIDKKKQGEVFEKLLTFSKLDPFKDRLAKNLSGGMKQKLSLVSALLQKPKLLVLDEPTVGLDPVARRELWHMMESLTAEGISVIWSTCYLDEAEKCDEVLLFNHGELLFSQDPRTLTKQFEGRTFYIKGVSSSLRDVLAHCMASPSTLDCMIQGKSVRMLLKSRGKLPALSDLEAGEGAYYEEAKPRFEDVFIDKLGGGPKDISPLAQKMSHFPNDDIHLIEAKGLYKRFGNFIAVNDVSFSVKRGEIFGFLGPNGAGKSTTFRMLCGLVKPDEGKAYINGVSFQEAPGAARGNIGYVAQKFSLYSNMSVKQNLRFFSGIYPVESKNRRTIIDTMISIFSFEPFLNTPAGELPLGYKQRLALACALMHRPEVLFLDEATSGVDPVTRREFWNHINGLVKKGTTVMITTHYMDEAEYCDRIGFLSNGKLVALGSPDELKEKVRSDALPEPTIEEAFIILSGGKVNG